MKHFLNETMKKIKIDKVVLSEDIKNPTASVIIVTHNPEINILERSIDLLESHTRNHYEILLIENSEKSQLENVVFKYNLNYIKLKRNYGITAARNIGIHYAKGDILIFLDDDAIPEKNFIDEHIQAHQQNNILALRGKCLPKTKSVFNNFAAHYDLGDDTMQYFIDLEGNSSFKKEILIQVAGFNIELQGRAGHEGLEISKRIINKTKNKNSIIYYPKAIIYHDYSKSLLHFIRKQIRHKKYRNYIIERFPDFEDFCQSYIRISKTNNDNLNYYTKGKIIIISRLTALLLRLV